MAELIREATVAELERHEAEPVMSRVVTAYPAAFRIAGWLCVGFLVWLSWIQREWEARTTLPGQIEHAIAYCGTAGLFALRYPLPR